MIKSLRKTHQKKPDLHTKMKDYKTYNYPKEKNKKIYYTN